MPPIKPKQLPDQEYSDADDWIYDPNLGKWFFMIMVILFIIVGFIKYLRS